MYKRGAIVALCGVVVLTATIAMLLLVTVAPSQTPVLAIDPPETVFESFVKGQRFTVNVTVSNVASLKAYQLKLSFDKAMLGVVGVRFLLDELLPSGNIKVVPGAICLNATFEGGALSTTKPAAIVSVTFEIKNYGLSPLHLFDTALINSSGQSIPHNTEDGMVQVKFHDVAVVGIEVSTRETYVGRIVQVNVTVKNLGTDAETVTVKVYYNDTEFFSSLPFSLPPCEIVSIICEWNTSGAPPKYNYLIKAEVSVVPHEANVSNNALADGLVKIKITGDINNDDIVDINDLIAWDLAYGSRVGDPNWNPQADINGDGIVDKIDGILIIQNYPNFR